MHDAGSPPPGTPDPWAAAWVDETLLAGPDDDVCLELDRPLDRAGLRAEVATRQVALTAAGLTGGGVLAVALPPSLAYVATVLAGWRAGAQVVLLDHRLTQHEVDAALERVAPQVVVTPKHASGGTLRGYQEVVEAVTAHPGGPAATPHALVQLSSGSTGPSKVIGRTAADLVAEIHRYAALEGMPRRGGRLVILNSLAHSYGLVGGLLHSLFAGVTVVVPRRTTADGILAAVAADPAPTTLMCVPAQVELLASVAHPPALPQLVLAITAGDRMRPDVAAAFAARYGVPLGEVYGMTETGVIATDLSGANRPATGWPAPGVTVRVAAGELLVRLPASPYLGPADPTRYVDGWLHTRDAAALDPVTGLVTVLGRLDSQVSVGGLKVDLTEVEHTLAALPGVRHAVVAYDQAIEAYVVLDPTVPPEEVQAALATRLAPFKRPRRMHVLDDLPRTATGKPLRDPAALRAAAQRPAVP